VKQLNLFELDNAPNSLEQNFLMTKEELIQWKNRIYEQQKQARLRTKTQQQSLFEISQNTWHEADEIEPLKLKLYPADFYRMPPALKYLEDVSVQGVLKQPGALTQQKSPLWAAEREKSYLS
jgi:hypothetical protein